MLLSHFAEDEPPCTAASTAPWWTSCPGFLDHRPVPPTIPQRWNWTPFFSLICTMPLCINIIHNMPIWCANMILQISFGYWFSSFCTQVQLWSGAASPAQGNDVGWHTVWRHTAHGNIGRRQKIAPCRDLYRSFCKPCIVLHRIQPGKRVNDDMEYGWKVQFKIFQLVVHFICSTCLKKPYYFNCIHLCDIPKIESSLLETKFIGHFFHYRL